MDRRADDQLSQPVATDIGRRMTSTFTAPTPSPVLSGTRQAFERAAALSPSGAGTIRLRFADLPVRMRVAGDLLAQRATAPFEHLIEPGDDAEPALHIDLWDRAHTTIGCPGVPYIPEFTHYLDAGLITTYSQGMVVRYERPQSVTCLDRVEGRILSCRRDARELALYEQSKPFPEMLATWYRDRGVLQLHAGLVSREGLGVLFVGQSGSGKSTCALACALADFDFLGDDYVGVQLDEHGACVGHSFYSGVRVDEGHLARFEALRDHAIPPACEWDFKSMVLMSRLIRQRMIRKTRIVAIVRTRVVGQGPTRYARASRVQVLLNLAPSTLDVPLSPGAAGFVSLMELMPRAACYNLEIGGDVREVPAAVHKLLDEAVRS